MSKPILITTSIAYVNAQPHVGHLLELLSADILKRFYRAKGEEVFFLTGTDEHGVKVAEAAKVASVSSQEFADQNSRKFAQLKADFSIDYDYFVRTTAPGHVEFVQECWQGLKDKNLLEKRTYKAKYCSGCEAFKTESELENGRCLIHHIVVSEVEEENYFFKLSQFQDQVLAWLKAGSVYPAGPHQEITSFVEAGLTDISVSRPKSKVPWGIEVKDDPDQIIYVWFEALLNYLSGLKLAGKEINNYWPADVQIIGKDILRFHAAIWPAILIALDLPLPKKILVHGFINVDGKKMSKSLGNVVGPDQLLERYGSEATRYLLFRQLSFYDDSNFVWSDFDALYNGELANGLGNLVARTVSLLAKFQEKIDVRKLLGQSQQELEANKQEILQESGLETFDFASELEVINGLIKKADLWITENQPWTWGKEADETKIKELIEASNLCRIAWCLSPFLPDTVKSLKNQLTTLESKPLFPRL
jgi:methionyl-tRNA synthetase